MTIVFRRDQTALHEAGHAAALVLSGRLPRELRADRPEAEIAGLTVFDFENESITPHFARALVVSVLCGPLVVGQNGWPPDWPMEDECGDAGTLRVLVDYLQLDEGDWYALVREAYRVADRSDFKRIVGLVASALERVDVLDADDLAYLLGEDTCLRFGLTTAKEWACDTSS